MTTSPPPTIPSHDVAHGPILLQVARGLAMGSADVVPGVSGGTVALILGIYRTLITALGSVSAAAVALVKGDLDGAKAHWSAVPWRFVLPLGCGMILALGIGSAVLPPLLESFPVRTSALFFGMIVASLVVPWAAVEQRGAREYGIAVVLAVAAFVVMGLPELVVEGDLPAWRIFISMAVAICAMILPGVSGAFLLLALGVYEPILEAVSSLDIVTLAIGGAGAVVGLGLFSRLLTNLLDNHMSITMAGLTGLMIGALRVLWPWGGQEGRLDAPGSASEAAVGLVLAVVGFAVIRGLLLLGERDARSRA